MQMYIVLGLLVFMIAMFFTHKVPYGVTTMTCCVMLALTGCLLYTSPPGPSLCIHIPDPPKDIHVVGRTYLFYRGAG